MTEMEILKKFNAPAGAVLVKQFKNGNIQIQHKVVCDRCGNKNGIYYTGVCNGIPVPSHVDNGVCFKCLGAGWIMEKEILRTPENQAKHDLEIQKEMQKRAEEFKKLEALRKAEEEARKAEEERKEAERQAEEARIKAEKAISQYVGSVGDKLEVKVRYLYTARFEVKSFYGFGMETMCIHNFVDDNGNKLIWKTSSGLPMDIEKDDTVLVKGTIKEHKEYKDEKQTSLTRCKVKKA